MILVSLLASMISCDQQKLGEDEKGEEQSDGPTFVDLGLSVKWATYNVGATAPHEYGDYYAWGETETKSSYTWENYRFRTSGESSSNVNFSKYNTVSTRGTVDDKATLDPEDDVAHVKWGDEWRMPTADELWELQENCTWTYTTQKGVKGFKVTSNKKGYKDRSIFLPATGIRKGSKLDLADDNGFFFWSSSMPTGEYWDIDNLTYIQYESYSAWYFGFYPENLCGGTDERCYGITVRPVCPSETWLQKTTISFGSDIVSLLIQGTTVLKAIIKDGTGDITKIPMLIKWESSNPSVATVDENGKVTALSLGSTVITAICNGKTATCTVIVKEPVMEYVDLGLSVKWATCNVGAGSPEDYGNYYAWGEIEPKSYYSWENYRFRASGDSYENLKFSKYNNSISTDGTADNKNTLDPEDDVAHVKWGGNWRMPTQSEQQELLDNCTWTWTTQNGVEGFKVSSNKSGYKDRYIFLPIVGFWIGTRLEGTDLAGQTFAGRMWSSSLILPDDDIPVAASNLYFWWSGDNQLELLPTNRCNGLSVRPVCP